jgi:ATP-dependent DNA helicase DinG
LSNPDFDISTLFADNGRISELMPHFEPRPEQAKMADQAERCLLQGIHTIIEAGTGTGKSLAYLAPAIKYAVSRSEKAVVSTHTINLQEQLINKDIPFIAEALGFEFKAGLAKGRGNYLCLRRLKFVEENNRSLFDGSPSQLKELRTWAETTNDGSLSSLAMRPDHSLWESVRSEHGNCRGRKCPHYNKCFYYKARRELEACDVIVLNHSLLLSDLVLRAQGASILPAYSAIVIDEAHNLRAVAEDHFGINISESQVNYLLSGLYDRKKNRGLLTGIATEELLSLVIKAREALDLFFTQVAEYYTETERDLGGKCLPGSLTDNLSEELRRLRLEINRAIGALSDEEKESDSTEEIKRAMERLQVLERDIKQFVNQPDAQPAQNGAEEEAEQKRVSIYWIECFKGRQPRYTLRSSPVEVGPEICRCLFDEYKSVLLTSATIACGKDETGFNFFANGIGLYNFEHLELDAIFDYSRNAKIIVEADLPEPSHPAFTARAVQALKAHILGNHGGTLVLFTSYSMLRSFAEELEFWAIENGRVLLRQEKGVSRTELIDKFRESGNAILLGTESFWQGVDVPGDALRCVVIMRLPFQMPTHPLVKGKIELMKKRGENPFMSYQVPMAIIRFKQGFGRLLRRKSDTGTIVIMDSRIVNKFYGRMFINALPKCEVEIKRAEPDW